MSETERPCPNCGCPKEDHRHGGIGVCSGGHGCEDTRAADSMSETETAREEAIEKDAATIRATIAEAGVSFRKEYMKPKARAADDALDRLLTRLQHLTQALEEIEPEKMERLAEWFDLSDREDLAAKLGVTVAEVPDYLVTSMEVQADLRKWAAAVRRALTPTTH